MGRAPFYPPLSLGIITAHLRSEGFIVEQDDLNIKVHQKLNNFNLDVLMDEKLLESYIRENKVNEVLEKNLMRITNQTGLKGFDIFLVSKGDVADLYLSIAICKKLKEMINIPIIMGGLNTKNTNFSDVYKIALEKKYIDFLIDGPGVESVISLLGSLNNNQNLENIPGHIYLKYKEIMKNDHAELKLPMKPDFKGLPLEKYVWNSKSFGIKDIKPQNILVIPFKFIEGCTWSCAFCRDSTNKLSYLSPQKVVESLKELSEEYNTKYFYFLNNLINPSKKYINELCDCIIKNNLEIYWIDCATFNNLDEETIFKMKKAGCISLTLGLDTGSQRLLNYIGKPITLEQVTNVLNWLNKAGIWVRVEVVCGLPTETKSDIKKTVLFLNKNKHLIDRTDFHSFFLMGTSKFLVEPEKYGLNNIDKTYIAERDADFYPHFFRYDINDVKWEEIEKKIEYSYKIIKQRSPNTMDISDFEQVPFLFLLYSNLNDKEKIKKTYKTTMMLLAVRYGVINTIKNPKKILKLYGDFKFEGLKIKIKMLARNLIDLTKPL